MSENIDHLLNPINHWLADKTVSEILINQPQEIWVEQGGQLKRFAIPEFKELYLIRLFQLIANTNEQRLNENFPLLSGSMPDGSRVQLVLPPTAVYPTLSIRRKVVRHLSLDDYKASNFYENATPFDKDALSTDNLNHHEQALLAAYEQQDWNAFIRLAITLKKVIVVSGGTSSGKTTFLNACLEAIPKDERVITLEDAREIDISHPNKVQLLASKGEQGMAKVTLQDLVQCCLRLRPERIIVGEIRGKEILDFLAACSTGHEGSITSIHANNPRMAFMRMTQMYKLNNVPSMTDTDIMRELNEVIDIIIQVAKTPQGRQVQGVYYKASPPLT